MNQASLMAMFSFSMSPLELVIRGSAMYVFLFLIFRFVLRRDVGSIAISDVLLLVLIADASQNAMAGDYKTVADGMVLVGTIVGWNWVLDWAAWHFEPVHRLLQAPPLPLVRHGRVLHRNLRKEFLTLDDLMMELRKQAVSDLAEVKHAQMEGDGQITVIKREGGAPAEAR
ncbi:DUF421 domain-containing protein [Ideonella azotifigens]|uniref:DUF421 domain-containing protein n=2 Tax=Ideonella azotifigens TaxID=513160 RepID=A0ABN1KFM1_9BURK|nr:YetF domain-containing protein [Ideonella azotifigens]MCD2340520.1 DUF421 domain-containing protein [Ideonella azotifigens]